MTTDHQAQVDAAREECKRLILELSDSGWKDREREKMRDAIDRLAALASAPQKVSKEMIDNLVASRLALASTPPAPAPEKIAPVQGWPAGIPWSLHLEAYAAYCKRYGPQPALIEGWCRGGFGTGELDLFIPGWRDRVIERRRRWLREFII